MRRSLHLVDPPLGEVTLPADLDDAQQLFGARVEIEALARAGASEVIVDCGAVERFSGPVVGWLTCAASAVHQRGGRLVLRHVRPDLARAINELVLARRHEGPRRRPAA